jgi:GDPmannose 4,6-dehydratase
VKEFLEHAFDHVKLDWKKFVEIDPKFYRPAEVDQLIGNAAKARKKLNWQPKTKFADLVRLMVDADIKLLKSQSATGKKK